MARAKCRYCKENVDTKTAYCVTIKERNYYFCNKQHYDAAVQKKAEEAKVTQEYDQIFKLTQEIFGYEFLGYPLLKRELNAWEKVATRQKIIAFLQENKDWLSKTMSREFGSDYNRVRYYSTIVGGKLHDFKPKVEVAEKPKIVVEEAIYDTSTQSFNKRRSLADLEDMF